MMETIKLMFQGCESTVQYVAVACAWVVVLGILPVFIAQYNGAAAVMSVGYELWALPMYMRWMNKHMSDEKE